MPQSVCPESTRTPLTNRLPRVKPSIRSACWARLGAVSLVKADRYVTDPPGKTKKLIENLDAASTGSADATPVGEEQR